MTVNDILAFYLMQNGFDGLHSHHKNNNYGGCCCGINNLQNCQEYCGDCEPAYAHKLSECKKCPDYKKCEPNKNIMYCGKCDITSSSPSNFRERLKYELNYKDMLIKELAYKTHIKIGTLNKYLKSRYSMPSAKNAVTIASALGVTVEYLITGIERKKNAPTK